MKLPKADWVARVLAAIEKGPSTLVTLVALAAIGALAFVRR